MPQITMPRLSDSMEEGVILEWLVSDGATVEEGDEIVEIETDKTNIAFEAEHDGVLRHGAAPGDAVAVGAPIGTIARPEPIAAEAAGDRRVSRRSASPTAARLASLIGVPLEQVRGTGRAGRVLRSDVISVHEASPAVVPAAIAAAPTPSPTHDARVVRNESGRRVPLTRVQRLVAERMVASKTTVPDFTVTRDMDLGEVHALRHELRTRGESAPSYNDVVLAAVARTVRNHPLLTAYFADGEIVYTDQVNLAVAVSTDAVLHAPVIHGADRLRLSEIAQASHRLSNLAHSGHLEVGDLQGGTFTVSNLGMYGVRHFTAIINTGQSAILAVGGVHETVVVTDGSFRVGWRAQMALSCDHRIIYGTHAAAFLRDLEATLQEPQLLA